MTAKAKTIIILGGARDFHAMDWYRTILRICPARQVVFVTDVFSGEGYIDLSKPGDRIHSLLVIDKFLFPRQFKYANLWRNFVKMILLPVQAYRFRLILKQYPNYVVHAHPMYYMALCLFARVEYIGTPQGSEILVRSVKSRIYRYFAKKILKSATAVTVDSFLMKNSINSIAGISAHVFQNGIDVEEITRHRTNNRRERIVSIRGVSELYRISEIVKSRNNSKLSVPLTFVYPFVDASYYAFLRSLCASHDEDLGRLQKNELYNLLSESLLVISIPSSDSSPRSVYESIFAGACVAVTYNKWIDVLPPCMRSRLYVVDLADELWLSNAISYARQLVNIPFLASKEALEMYDENKSIAKVIEQLY
jgi:hypothetical protein